MSLLDRVQRKAEEGGPPASGRSPNDPRTTTVDAPPDPFAPQVPPPKGWEVHNAPPPEDIVVPPPVPIPESPPQGPAPGGPRPEAPSQPGRATPTNGAAAPDLAARQTSLLNRTGLGRVAGAKSGGP